MSSKIHNVVVIGASGYGGAQLAALLTQHPSVRLRALLVSPKSSDLGKVWQSIYPEYWLALQNHYQLHSYEDYFESTEWSEIDTVFLATPHEASVKLAAHCLADGKQVIDLSGAYRIKDLDTFSAAYQFNHDYPQLVAVAQYGLPEINAKSLVNKQLVAVAGCYPTASILGLAPLAQHDFLAGVPVISAVSGVSGAGRKASLGSSFCEVSLQAYGIGCHRHQPEIEQALSKSKVTQKVVFTPHLGSFKRGILATIVTPVSDECNQDKLVSLYENFYAACPFVEVVSSTPALKDVVNTPNAKLSVKWLADTKMAHITVAIDNLMKGAASSAVQCFNISNQFDETLGLVATALDTGAQR